MSLRINQNWQLVNLGLSSSSFISGWQPPNRSQYCVWHCTLSSSNHFAANIVKHRTRRFSHPDVRTLKVDQRILIVVLFNHPHDSADVFWIVRGNYNG